MSENNNTLLEKLDGLVARFEEVSTLITDPSVIADQKRYVKLTKEYKELGDLMKARKEYMQCLAGLEEAKAMMNESDPEMKEMAREEAAACEARIPELEEEIKLLLIPADPQDDRNAILEIRGGTGGDEAAIFAGDLFRMYSKYCERKGWKLEVSSASEGASGGCAPGATRTRHRNPGACTYFGGICSRIARSRTLRCGNQRRRNQMGYVPKLWCRRSECEQSGIGRTPAL